MMASFFEDWFFPLNSSATIPNSVNERIGFQVKDVNILISPELFYIFTWLRMVYLNPFSAKKKKGKSNKRRNDFVKYKKSRFILVSFDFIYFFWGFSFLLCYAPFCATKRSPISFLCFCSVYSAELLLVYFVSFLLSNKTKTKLFYITLKNLKKIFFAVQRQYL